MEEHAISYHKKLGKYMQKSQKLPAFEWMRKLLTRVFANICYEYKFTTKTDLLNIKYV